LLWGGLFAEGTAAALGKGGSALTKAGKSRSSASLIGFKAEEVGSAKSAISPELFSSGAMQDIALDLETQAAYIHEALAKSGFTTVAYRQRATIVVQTTEGRFVFSSEGRLTPRMHA
jgi:hypothetical protein